MKTQGYFSKRLSKTQEHARLTARNAFTIVNGVLVSMEDARLIDIK